MAVRLQDELKGGPPKLNFSFPKTRYYLRQALINPDKAMKTVLHKILPAFFEHPDPFKKDRDRRIQQDKLLDEDERLRLEEIRNRGRPNPELKLARQQHLRKKKEMYEKRRKVRRKKKTKPLEMVRRVRKTRQVNRGGFGVIFKAKAEIREKSGLVKDVECAAKVIPKKKWSLFGGGKVINDRHIILQEVIALKRVHEHQHIIQFFGTKETKKDFIILTEFCPYPDLADLLERSTQLKKHKTSYNKHEPLRARFDCKVVQFIMAPIFSALAHIHRMGYVHRDIKPQNVVVAKDGTPKLCDMGLCFAIQEGRMTDGNVGSSYYKAPEQAVGADFNETLDTWQVGISMLVLAFGYSPYFFMNSNNISWEMRRGRQNDYNNCVVLLFITYYSRDFYKQNEQQRKTCNRTVQELLRLNRTFNLESEDTTIWRGFQRFLKKIMIFDIEERPTCEQVTKFPYVETAIEEWESRNFYVFEEEMETWRRIIDNLY